MSRPVPGSNERRRFFARKARQVARMLDGGTYAQAPLDYVYCRGNGCREKLARIMVIDGRPALEIMAPLGEEDGVWVLERPARPGGGLGLLRPAPSERLTFRCARCRSHTPVDVAALKRALDAVLPRK